MPHIPIILDWKQRAIQADSLAHQLENYNGSNQSEAATLLEELETTWSGTLKAVEVDDVATRIETFLGI
jgi:hypothetical protein